MKLKVDIEKAKVICGIKRNEAKSNEDKEMISYYLGWINALNWVCGNRNGGIADMGIIGKDDELNEIRKHFACGE